HVLAEALGVYQSHEVVALDLLARLCHAIDPGARAYAAGVVGAWADRLPDPLALLRPLVQDEHPRVRLQAVVACTYVPKAEAMEVAAIAADFPTEGFLAYALNQAVFALKPYWLPAFKVGEWKLAVFRATAEGLALDAGGDEKIRRAAIAALASFGGDTNEKILSRLTSDPAPPVQSAAIAALCALNLDAAARFASARFAQLK